MEIRKQSHALGCWKFVLGITLRGNDLTRDQVLADAEVLKGTFGLGAPFVGGNLDLDKAVSFGAISSHNNQRDFLIWSELTNLWQMVWSPACLLWDIQAFPTIPAPGS